jgi:hypothetical protein
MALPPVKVVPLLNLPDTRHRPAPPIPSSAERDRPASIAATEYVETQTASRYRKSHPGVSVQELFPILARLNGHQIRRRDKRLG